MTPLHRCRARHRRGFKRACRRDDHDARVARIHRSPTGDGAFDHTSTQASAVAGSRGASGTDDHRSSRWRKPVSDRPTFKGLTQIRTTICTKSLVTRSIQGRWENWRNWRLACDNDCGRRSQTVDSKWRDVRVVEGARLESVCRGNSTEGSNPSLSAILLRSRLSSARASAGWRR